MSSVIRGDKNSGSDFWASRSSQPGSYRAGSSGSGGGLDRSGVVPYANLAATTNRFMTDEARKPYEVNLPGYSDMVAKRSSNTGELLAGKVPGDVLNQIIQAGAERGILTGSPGGANANAAWLRALGLTSLGLQQQGSQNLSQSISDTPVSPLMNPASLYVPEDASNRELSAARSGMGRGASGASSIPGLALPRSIDTRGAYGAPYQKMTPASWQSEAVNPIAYGPGGGAGAWISGITPGNGANYSYNNYWDSALGLQNPNRPADMDNGWGDVVPQGEFSYGNNYDWNSPAGLQNPDRPADELTYDSSWQDDGADFWN